jgi:hypothetical protein
MLSSLPCPLIKENFHCFVADTKSDLFILLVPAVRFMNIILLPLPCLPISLMLTNLTTSPSLTNPSSTKMCYEINSVPHTACFASQGPGPRSTDCGICLEPKTTDDNTVIHQVCGNSFHATCFEKWSHSCRLRRLHVTCPTCRAVLAWADTAGEVDTDESEEELDLSDSEEEAVDQNESLRVYLLFLERVRRPALARHHGDVEWRRELLERRIQMIRERMERDRDERRSRDRARIAVGEEDEEETEAYLLFLERVRRLTLVRNHGDLGSRRERLETRIHRMRQQVERDRDERRSREETGREHQ